MVTIDARGLSCPEPLIMLKAAIDEAKNNNASKEMLLLVDNKTALDNCKYLATRKGYTFDIENKDDAFEVRLYKQ